MEAENHPNLVAFCKQINIFTSFRLVSLHNFSHGIFGIIRTNLAAFLHGLEPNLRNVFD
jgi:hypothetical protein